MTPGALSPGRGRRPRVLMVVTLAEVGGVGSYLAQLLPGLVDEFDVTVAAHGEGPLQTVAADLAMPFIPLTEMRRSIDPVHDVLAVGELARIMRRLRPDILHAHSSKAGLLARAAAVCAGVPVRIFTVHGWAYSAYTGVASSLFRWAERGARPMTSMIVCPSAAVRATGIRQGTCSARHSVVIPNAVDVRATPVRRHAPDGTRIVSVGRLAHPKDFGTLVDALARMRPAGWTASIVGDGPQRGEIGHAIAGHGLGDRVELLGTRHDVSRILAESDVFVLSSASECLPMSIIEAMAAGIPVVASAVGGVPELVLDGVTGVLVRPGDPDALSRALEVLVADAALRARMGAAGRERALAHFDVTAFRRAHAALYVRELRRAGRRPRIRRPRTKASGARPSGRPASAVSPPAPRSP